jgi:hypothetical protein
MSDKDFESTDADAVEQDMELDPDSDQEPARPPDLPLEADPADVAEHARDAGDSDEDDYR